MIDFNNIEEKEYKNFKNGEGSFFAKIIDDKGTKIIKGRLKKGSSIGLHTHINDFEIIYVLKGKATFYLDNKEEICEEGECHYCKKGSVHTMKNLYDEDLEIFAVVSLK